MTDLKTRPCRWLFIDLERDQPAFSEHRNAHPSVHSYCSFIAVHWSTRLHTAGTHEFTHFNNIIKSSQRGSKPLHTIISLFVTPSEITVRIHPGVRIHRTPSEVTVRFHRTPSEINVRNHR